MWIEIASLIAILGIPIVVVVVKYIQKQRKCIDIHSKTIFRTKKALLVLANRLDDINKEQHGKTLNLGPEIELILKDEKEHT